MNHTGVSRKFLGWDRPILAAAVEVLAESWTGGCLDLSAAAVVVPTAEAGRKLRAALAAHAALKEEALLAPEIMTPEGVLAWGSRTDIRAASETESLLAWVEVLQEMDLSTVPHVFPLPPEHPDFSWALQMAITFRRLLHTLGEAGWSMAQAAARFGADFPEAQRWSELSLLERRYEANLARFGLVDRNRAMARAALTVRAPAGLKQLFVFGVPEPLPLVRTAWGRLAESGVPVHICIQAPAILASSFDEWGVPVAITWTSRSLPLTDAVEQIQLLANPLAQADRLLELVSTSTEPLAVGVVDKEILPLAMVKFEERGIPSFNPEGVAFSEQSLFWMLTCWQELLAGRSWSAWEQWIRVPEVLLALGDEISLPAETSQRLGQGSVLWAADDCATKHLPGTLADALGALKRTQKLDGVLGQALHVTSRWLDSFVNEDFSIALTDFLDRIYRSVEWPKGDPKTTAFRQASEHLLAQLDQVTRAAASLPRRLEPAQMLQLLLRLLREVRLFPGAADHAVELSGWLEMPWQTAPHLLLAGINDGLVPTAITADAWLPHGLRGMLNLRTNDERFAVDAFRLAAMLEQRKQSGSVRLLLGRESNSSDPLTPSRLLLLCASDELPIRVRELFAEPPETNHSGAAEWQRAWKLRPRLPKEWQFTKISATVFQKYLQCPFRYFLEMVLKMQDYDPTKQEMDHLDFGNLCHNAVEALAKDPIMKDERDVARVAAFLKEKAAEHVAHTYGPTLSVPLLVQRNSIQQRLAAAAPIFVQSRLEGWEIRYVEEDVRQIIGSPWIVEGVQISGRIDMVEYNETLQKWRIIDYKTSAKPMNPAVAHLTNAPKKAREPKPHELHFIEAATLADGRRWKNLQLPLYAAALQQHFGQPVEAAYLNLPPAMSQVKLSLWPELNQEELPAHAVKCAAAVIRCIKDAQFWPPNPRPDYENFARLFVDDMEESIDPTTLLEDAAVYRETQLANT